MDDTPMLTDEEEEGILAAIEELDSGKGIPLVAVIREILGGQDETD